MTIKQRIVHFILFMGVFLLMIEGAHLIDEPGYGWNTLLGIVLIYPAMHGVMFWLEDFIKRFSFIKIEE